MVVVTLPVLQRKSSKYVIPFVPLTVDSDKPLLLYYLVDENWPVILRVNSDNCSCQLSVDTEQTDVDFTSFDLFTYTSLC